MNKRLLVGLAAAGIVGGGTYGFAATLGVTSDNLGAGSAVVASCDATVDVDYTTGWDATSELYEVTGVTVSGIDAACNGDDIKVSLVDTDGVQQGEEISDTVITGTMSFNFAADNATAQEVTGVHVVISGGDVAP